MVKTIQWSDAGIVMIDQRLLPRDLVFLTCRTYKEVADAISSMAIRGAPAIGIAAAMGIALGFREGEDFENVCNTLAGTRPTAVNLFWAIDRMRRLRCALESATRNEVSRRLIEEAEAIRQEDLAVCQAIGRYGAALVPDGKTVLTHCNAGGLGTAGYGTALGVIRAAIGTGKRVDVLAGETRPLLQGSRLTAWELQQDGIGITLITDSMAGHFLRSGRIGCVLVGADRIASNGDVANKIGTYTIAVLAKENGIPFYVAAPVSTLDFATSSGEEIPIEHRSSFEVTHLRGTALAPEGIGVENPAFDITPARYVTAIICENGVARAPYDLSLRTIANQTSWAAVKENRSSSGLTAQSMGQD